MLLFPRILDEHRCIYSCLQIPPRENWFQYVRRVSQPQLTFLALLPCLKLLLAKFDEDVLHLLSVNLPATILVVELEGPLELLFNYNKHQAGIKP